jgi:K+-sensing histidine kinase KdpD
VNNDLKFLVEQILSYFEGQQENLQIELSTDLKENAFIHANPTLLDVLLTNLIKNAFFHNIKEGHVDIKITSASIEIKNSSDLPEIPQAKLYQRFAKQSAKKDSWGLGLAIAKRICDSNGWPLQYSFDRNEHCFKILFVTAHGA